MRPVTAWVDGIYNTKICVYEWVKRQPKAVIILLHGMAEHALRYERFATAMVENGYAVMSMDLRGHGQTAQKGIKGYFSGDQGDIAVLSDVQKLCMRALDIYGNVPLILFGHSMGSVIAECSAIRFGDLYKGVVLSGVTTDKKGRRFFAPIVAKMIGSFGSDAEPSPKLQKMTFGSYNKPYEPNARTEFEWLSRIPEEVDKYVADPRCGFTCTPQLFHSVAKMLLFAINPGKIRKIPKDLKFLILAGSDDPVGGKPAVEELSGLYRKKRLNVESKIYEEARHEILNDLCEQEVIQDILNFMEPIVKK